VPGENRQAPPLPAARLIRFSIRRPATAIALTSARNV
jgi:hypothetical protein